MGKNNTLSNRIKSRRQALNLSQSELSKQLNCTQAALSQYEKGSREPGLADLSNIAKALHTTTDYLLGLTDIASTDGNIKEIGDYLGLTETSIKKLHLLFFNVKSKTDEQELQNEVNLLSGRAPGEEGYDDDYNFVKTYAIQDLQDHIKTINEFICSQEFDVFISSIKHNLYLERSIYDIFRIAKKQYGDIESPCLHPNIEEDLPAFVADSEDNIKHYSLNLFDAQNALIDFCRNITKLEEIKKLEYSESLYKKVHFYLYMCTHHQEAGDSYYSEEMEKEMFPIIEPHLPIITDLLEKKR